MTIETNLKYLEYELAQVLELFKAEYKISHRFTESDDKYINTVEIDGELYRYESDCYSSADELIKKRMIKRSAKLAIYLALEKRTGQSAPWGALTGIRPVKLAYMAKAEGKDPVKFLEEEMKVSAKKADMVGRILKSQEGIYEEKEENCDFFISIPFCPTKCVYCSFISAELSKVKDFVPPYVDMLCREIEAAKKSIRKLRSVYIGGGTPISLEISSLKRILEAVGEVGCEYTVEAGRPDCMSEEKLSLLKDYNVNRICVNPQTFNDKTLKAIGRAHGSADIFRGFEMARKYSFDINMDLIAGLPDEKFSDFRYSIDRARELKPENITVHTLCLKKGSSLKERIERLNEGEVGEMINYSYDSLLSDGYEPYYMYRQKYMAGNLENTGYCLPGKSCIYNVDIMEERAQIIACGANAVSKRVYKDKNRIERLASPKDLKTYIEKGGQIIEEKEKFFA